MVRHFRELFVEAGKKRDGFASLDQGHVEGDPKRRFVGGMIGNGAEDIERRFRLSVKPDVVPKQAVLHFPVCCPYQSLYLFRTERVVRIAHAPEQFLDRDQFPVNCSHA